MLNAVLIAPLLFGQSYGTDAGLLGPYSNTTFGSFQPLTEDINAGVYNGRSLNLAAGSTPADFLTLGDINASTEVGQFTFGEILNSSGVDDRSLTLKDFPLLANSSLEQVAQATGDCNQVCQQSGTQEGFLSNVLIDGSTVGEAINRGDGQKTLAETLGIDKQLSDIKKARDAVIGKLNKWEQEVINNIPGLSQVPLLRFPAQIANTSLAGASLFARADLILDKAEKGVDNTVTGSDKEKTKFNTPCLLARQQVCGHLELNDFISVGMAGKRWINGKHQKVRGGSGALGALFGGKEPTGRLPFGPGSPFKLVLTKTDESTDTFTFSAYFRVCEFLAGCTPYAFGPFPLYSGGYNDPVWMGFNPQDLGQFPLGFDPAIISPPGSPTSGGIPFGLPGIGSNQGTGEPNKCANGNQASYIWPAPGPVTSPFSYNRVNPANGIARPHLGTDVGAPFGTPTVASEAGEVIWANWDGGYGLTVEVREACSGLILRYAHLQKAYVKLGQPVKKGQPVGEIGSTGLSTGPHLHFEMRRGGRYGIAIDPQTLLPPR